MIIISHVLFFIQYWKEKYTNLMNAIRNMKCISRVEQGISFVGWFQSWNILNVNTRNKFHISAYHLEMLPVKESYWLPVKELSEYRELLITFKCINGLAPSYLSRNYVSHSNLHNYNTHHKTSLKIPVHGTTTGQRTFKFRSIKLWNELSDDL